MSEKKGYTPPEAQKGILGKIKKEVAGILAAGAIAIPGGAEAQQPIENNSESESFAELEKMHQEDKQVKHARDIFAAKLEKKFSPAKSAEILSELDTKLRKTDINQQMELIKFYRSIHLGERGELAQN